MRPSNHEKQGSLGETRVQDVLLEVEQLAIDAQVWIETESGVGEVLFAQGQMVRARLGGARGKTALLRLLPISEGRYGIKRCSVVKEPAIVASVAKLIELHKARRAEWLELCSSAPPLNSVLTLTATGESVRNSSRGIQRVVLVLIDGTRTLMQVLEESSFDPIDALKTVTQALAAELARIAPPATSLFPLASTANTSERLPTPAPAPFMQSAPALATPNLDPLTARRSTLKGLGAKPTPAGTRDGLAPARIIEIASEPYPQHANAGPEKASAFPDMQAVAAPSLKSDERRHIDRYEVLFSIGRSWAGTVYLARLTKSDLGFRRLYALKLMHTRFGEDAPTADEFLRSATIAANLQHANVVSVHDAGVHEKQPYVVMDYVEGCGLNQLMYEGSRGSPQHLLPVVIDALAGLHAVRALEQELGLERRLVRNVTPESILVGVDGTARVTNFALLPLTALPSGYRTPARAGYVAPECVTGGVADGRADVFSIGVTLWNALTGMRLFTGDTTEEVLANVRNQSIRPPTAAGARSSPELDEIVMCALARDPLARFGSPEAMLIALDSVGTRFGGMATPKEIASWVRQTAGAELAQRRLSILDATRENPSLPPPPVAAKSVIAPGTHPSDAAPPFARSPELGRQPRGSVADAVPNPVVSSMFYSKEDYSAAVANTAGGPESGHLPAESKFRVRFPAPWVLVAILALIVSLVINFMLMHGRK